MQKLSFEDGKANTEIGDYFLEVDIDDVGEEEGESFCINATLLGVDDAWYAKASFNPDTIFDLIEALQTIAYSIGLEKPPTSLFVYNGEPGQA